MMNIPAYLKLVTLTLRSFFLQLLLILKSVQSISIIMYFFLTVWVRKKL